MGGKTGEDFSKLLEPIGFVREYVLFYDNDRGHAVMDFAHLQLKINVELDGPYHQASKEHDEKRDEALSAKGWIVLRIKHD